MDTPVHDNKELLRKRLAAVVDEMSKLSETEESMTRLTELEDQQDRLEELLGLKVGTPKHFLIRGEPLLSDLLEDVSPSDHVALNGESVLLTILEEYFETQPLVVQLLPVIYRFEQFLLRFIRLDTAVDVFFFHDQRSLFTPTQLLFREAVINHFKHHHSTHATLKELEKTSEFVQYMDDINPKYLFFHYQSGESHWKPILEALMQVTLASSRDFSFTTHVIHRSNKLFGYRVRHIPGQHTELPAALEELSKVTAQLTPFTRQAPATYATPLEATLAALKLALPSVQRSESTTLLAQAILVQASLLAILPIEARAFSLNLENSGWAELKAGEFLEHFVAALSKVIESATGSTLDYFDSRLWLKIVENFGQAAELGIPEGDVAAINAALTSLQLPLLNSAPLSEALKTILGKFERATTNVVAAQRVSNPTLTSLLKTPSSVLAENPLKGFLKPIPWHSDVSLETDWLKKDQEQDKEKAEKQKKKGKKERGRQQLYSALQKYAESLQGAAVQRQTIIVEKEKKPKAKTTQQPQKKNKAPSQREQLQSKIQDDKDTKDATKYLEEYQTLKRLWKNQKPAIKLERVNLFIHNCPPVASLARFLAYMKKLRLLDEQYEDEPTTRKKVVLFQLVQFIYDTFHAQNIGNPPTSAKLAAVQKTALNQGDLQELVTTLSSLGLKDSAQLLVAHWTKKGKPNVGKITESTPKFQLGEMGEHLPRPEGHRDERVYFKPDDWQIELLNIVDEGESALVVAPTSSGKTFISYYCMEQVLRESDDGIVVFVSPTKALVNQVTAEVYARFSKKFTYAGQNLFGYVTKDFFHKPLTCQLLITAPQVFEELLMSPQNQEWSKRIRYVIFDEVHMIGDEDAGQYWEHLLQLLRCPFLALSATVANPESFSSWLEGAQAARRRVQAQRTGKPVHLIIHKDRWSDLRVSVYNMKDSSFDDVHPMAGLRPHDLLEGFPSGINLEPRDGLALFEAMKLTDASAMAELEPDLYFATDRVIKRQAAKEWTDKLTTLLVKWIQEGRAGAGEAMARLTPAWERLNSTKETSDQLEKFEQIEKLIRALRERGQLPALFFNFDRTVLESITRYLVGQLESYQDEELRQRAKELQHMERAAEAAKRRAKKQEKIKGSAKEEDASEALAAEEAPEIPLEVEQLEKLRKDIFIRHSFVGPKSTLELGPVLRRTGLPEDSFILRALRLGIGIHHPGLNKRIREATERLFRAGHIQIVLSTNTLALGIHMPCKTVVFVDDSPHLNTLQYRQCAGRAGRRGYDELGRVVFFNFPMDKVTRLQTSNLARLRGQFPISATYLLKLLNMVTRCKDPSDAKQVLTQVLSQPFFATMEPAGAEQLVPYAQAAVDFLRGLQLVDDEIKPIGLAPLACYQQEIEPQNFALALLLQSGYLNRICAKSNPAETTEERAERLLRALSYFCFVRPVHAALADPEAIEGGPCQVVLETTDPEIREVVNRLNQLSVHSFSPYVAVLGNPTVALPLSQLNLQRSPVAAAPNTLLHVLSQQAQNAGPRNPLSALTGKTEFTDPFDLVTSSRGGFYIDHSTVPHIALPKYVNTYALDFWKHQQIRPLVRQNRIKIADMWAVLNDWTVFLKGFHVAVEKLSPQAQMEDVLITLDYLNSTFEARFKKIFPSW